MVNRKTIIALIIMVIAIIIFLILFAYFYTSPKKHYLSTYGVKYQLGTENNELVEPISIIMDGEITKTLTNKSTTFIGTIEIGDEKIPARETAEEIEIVFNENGHGTIQYFYILDNKIHSFSYGRIYVDEHFSEITILISDKDELTQGSWNSANGYMITAPASNREEALEIANRLLKTSSIGVNPLK